MKTISINFIDWAKWYNHLLLVNHVQVPTSLIVNNYNKTYYFDGSVLRYYDKTGEIEKKKKETETICQHAYISEWRVVR